MMEEAKERPKESEYTLKVIANDELMTISSSFERNHKSITDADARYLRNNLHLMNDITIEYANEATQEIVTLSEKGGDVIFSLVLKLLIDISMDMILVE